MSNALTASDFDQLVAGADKPVLVDFWAAWCGPCRALGPVVEEVAEEMSGKIDVYKCNVDEESELAQKFQIASIPTLILFKDGQPAHTIMGNRPKADLEKEILTHL